MADNESYPDDKKSHSENSESTEKKDSGVVESIEIDKQNDSSNSSSSDDIEYKKRIERLKELDKQVAKDLEQVNNSSEPKKTTKFSPKKEEPPSEQMKLPKLSTKALLIWGIVLLVVPMLLFSIPKMRAKKPVILTQSSFEQALNKGLIVSATVVNSTTGATTKVVGKTYRSLADKNNATLANVTKKDANDNSNGKSPSNGYDPVPYTVKVIYSERLEKLLNERPGIVINAKDDSSFFKTLLSFSFFILLFVILYFLFQRQLKSASRGAMLFGKSKARLMNTAKDKVTFADVGGVDEAKEEMMEIVEFLEAPEKFKRLGGRIPRGVLMVGAPGTGKTLLARAIAGEADVPFFTISGSDFVEMFVGVGASRVRDMFEEGKRHAPCLLFIDEIDAVGRSRGNGLGGGNDEREQTLNALLVEMDGFEANSGMIVIAATNRPDVLDSALLRPGRFDRQISIDLPDLKGRTDILKLHARKVKMAETVNLELVARGTPGFSGADLANMINEAALIAAKFDKDAIDQMDMDEARDKVRWGKERRSRTVNEKERRLTAFHEAGHALAGILCEHATPLHKITIIPRGRAYLGATMHLPANDRYTQGRKEMYDELVVAMGGRVAEELNMDDITSGASADIAQATKLAKKMVCEWGMSDLLGPVLYSSQEEHIYLGRDIKRGSDHSEETSKIIDAEVKRIIKEAYARSVKLLKDNNDKLTILAESLLEKETMSAKEVYELLDIKPIGDKAIAVYERAKEEHQAVSEVLANSGNSDTVKKTTDSSVT